MVIVKILVAFAGDLLNVLFAILPVLLVAAMFNFRAFKKSAELQFFLLAAAIMTGWRFVFCFFNGGGITARYIAVLPLFFILFAVLGIPVLADWAVKLSARANLHVKRRTVIPVLLAIAVAVSLGKALNPPDRKAYIQETARELQNAPAHTILIDSTAENERILFDGNLKQIEIKAVSKYSRGKEDFFMTLTNAYLGCRKQSLPFYLLVKVPDEEDFVKESKKRLGDFPFDKIHSTKVKKAIVLLYKSR